MLFSFLTRNTSESLWSKMEQFIQFRSENTQRAYKTAIRDLCAFLGVEQGSRAGEYSISKLTGIEAMNYLLDLKKRVTQDGGQTAPATLTQRLALLRALYGFLVLSHIVEANPWDEAKTMVKFAGAGQKRPTRTLSVEKVRALLDQPDTKTKEGIRDRAALAILFGGALRRSEALGLLVGDINVTDSATCLCLRQTKGGGYQEQPLPAWATERFMRLVLQRKNEGAKNTSPLFVGYDALGNPGRPLTERTFSRNFKKHCLAAGAGDLAPHAARATAITRLLSEGHGYEQVKEFARHKSFRMVEVYDKRAKVAAATLAKNLNF